MVHFEQSHSRRGFSPAASCRTVKQKPFETVSTARADLIAALKHGENEIVSKLNHYLRRVVS